LDAYLYFGKLFLPSERGDFQQLKAGRFGNFDPLQITESNDYGLPVYRELLKTDPKQGL